MKTFREAFCARHACSEAGFTRKVFWKTVRPRPLALVIAIFSRKYFEADRALIRKLGQDTCIDAFERRVEAFKLNEWRGHRGGLRKKLRLRVRKGPLLKLAEPLIASRSAQPIRQSPGTKLETQAM